MVMLVIQELKEDASDTEVELNVTHEGKQNKQWAWIGVYYRYAGGAKIHLTREQTIELRDYLNTILEENENGRTVSE